MNLEIDVTPSYCNDWPFLSIKNNNIEIFDDQIIEQQCLSFDLECDKSNILYIKHYGKSFGADDIWDTNEESDRYIIIEDIRFDGVSIDHLLGDMLFHNTFENGQEYNLDIAEFKSYGQMRFNGYFELSYETPIYDWLILTKYKKPLSNNAFFSNSTTRWHYEDDIELINEIKEMFRED